MVRICFVCLGNICRSPTAEGIMRHLLHQADCSVQVEVDSAGTSAYHVGAPPDARSTQAAARRGIRLSGASRQITTQDFDRFDLLVAMDQSNVRALQRVARTPAQRAKIVLLRGFDPASPSGAEVPDPYYGGPQGFDDVLDICEAGCAGLLAHVMASSGEKG